MEGSFGLNTPSLSHRHRDSLFPASTGAPDYSAVPQSWAHPTHTTLTLSSHLQQLHNEKDSTLGVALTFDEMHILPHPRSWLDLTPRDRGPLQKQGKCTFFQEKNELVIIAAPKALRLCCIPHRYDGNCRESLA